jgi:hypothetical protein
MASLPDELLVTFRFKAPRPIVDAAVNQIGGTIIERDYVHPSNADLYVIRLPAGMDIVTTLAKYRQHPDVARASKHPIVRLGQ